MPIRIPTPIVKYLKAAEVLNLPAKVADCEDNTVFVLSDDVVDWCVSGFATGMGCALSSWL